MIVFRVLGTPKGQPRPRAFVRGRHAGVYNPDTADDWKAAIAVQAARYAPAKPLEGPVSVQMTFAMPRPQRLRRAISSVPHVAKPDIDNLVKAVLDVLTRVGFWADDAQVSHLLVAKHYALPEQEPGVSLILSPH